MMAVGLASRFLQPRSRVLEATSCADLSEAPLDNALKPYLESQGAQNNRLLYPKLAQNRWKVAQNSRPLSLQVRLQAGMQ